MLPFKKIDLYRDFTAGVYLSEAQNLFTKGMGAELNQREG
jgi:hypothetical protein